MFLNLQRIIKETATKKIDPPKLNKNLKKISDELSPKTIRKNLSNDNFLKFQWAWTL
tara:strand:+ start:228 stop:398 length:171 start_codon:yes stop_codon:yes gene_type:complete